MPVCVTAAFDGCGCVEAAVFGSNAYRGIVFTIPSFLNISLFNCLA